MKLGVIGLGRIAYKVIETTLVNMKDVELYAVGSRSKERAEDFQKKFGFKKAYSSYEELVADSDVELVYICTPHSEHYENIKLCINHGKNVLCEKSFTLNAEQAKEAVRLAREKDVFLAEAIWPRYKKITGKITEIINSGIVGKVRFLSANLSYPVTFKERIMDLSLGGGALLDVGVYPINFALTHFGYEIEKIEASCTKAKSGVDKDDMITFFYKDGRVANLVCGIDYRSDRRACFYGDEGYIVINNINMPSVIEVYNKDDESVQKYEEKNIFSGYEYEFSECISCIENNKKESTSMPLDETVKVLEILDEIRRQTGVVFPQE